MPSNTMSCNPALGGACGWGVVVVETALAFSNFLLLMAVTKHRY